MLNLFQHLIESNSYETLKRVQGDKKCIATQSRRGGKLSRASRDSSPSSLPAGRQGGGLEGDGEALTSTLTLCF
jgi:hypothetical protein